jgi:branched-chain amino acid transport system substrate-binding protein
MTKSGKESFRLNAGVSRRRFIKSSGLLGAGLMLPVTSPFIRNAVAADEPIRIGMVVAKQGALGEQGLDLAKGVMTAFKEAGNRAIGRPIELTWLDEPNPQASTQAATKLVEDQKVSVLIGGMSSPSTFAISAVANENRVPYLAASAVAREVTGTKCNPFTFRSANPSIPVYGRAMFDEMIAKGKKWYFLVSNFAFGDDVLSTFTELLKEAGGTVIGADRAPIDTSDYSSYALKIRQAKPDVLACGIVNMGSLLKQLRDFGMMSQFAVCCPGTSDTDLWSVPQDALLGTYAKSWFYDDPNNPDIEKAFIADHIKENNKPPADRVYQGWFTAKILLGAIEKAESSDRLKILEGIGQATYKYEGVDLRFRDFDHQWPRPPVVATAVPNAVDKYKILKILPQPKPTPEYLTKLFGTKEQVGCNMEKI